MKFGAGAIKKLFKIECKYCYKYDAISKTNVEKPYILKKPYIRKLIYIYIYIYKLLYIYIYKIEK